VELLIKNSTRRNIVTVIFLFVFVAGFVIVSFSAGEKFYTSTPLLIAMPLLISSFIWFSKTTIKNGTFVLLLSSNGILIKFHNRGSYLIEWDKVKSIKSTIGIKHRDYTSCKKFTFGNDKSYEKLYILFQDKNTNLCISAMCNGDIYEKPETDEKLIVVYLTENSSKVLSKIFSFRSSLTKKELTKA